MGHEYIIMGILFVLYLVIVFSSGITHALSSVSETVSRRCRVPYYSFVNKQCK